MKRQDDEVVLRLRARADEGRGDEDARVAAGERRPVQEHGFHRAQEAEGDEEEVDAAYARRRDDERHGEERSDRPGGEEADPHREPELGRQERRRVGADGEEGDVAERVQPGEAEQTVADHEHDVREHEDADVGVVVAADERHEDDDGRQRGGQDAEEGPAHAALLMAHQPLGPDHEHDDGQQEGHADAPLRPQPQGREVLLQADDHAGDRASRQRCPCRR